MRYSYEKYSPTAEKQRLWHLDQSTTLLFSDPGYLVFDAQQGLDPNKAIAFCRNSFDATSIVAALNASEERKAVNGRS